MKSDKSSSQHKSLVLVVDDEALFRYLARESLIQAGLRVQEAENGLEAVMKYEEFKPDIVLMDIKMPEMDGFTACKRIREISDGEEVPIVMITAYDDLDSVLQAYELNATDFITKPVNWQMLGHRVNFLLRTKERIASTLKKKIQDVHLDSYVPESQKNEDDTTVLNRPVLENVLALEKEVGPVILNEIIDILKSSVYGLNQDEKSATTFFPLYDNEYSQEPSINQQRLNKIKKYDEGLQVDFVKEAIHIFMQETPNILQQIQESITTKHYPQMIFDVLHLKHKSQFLGFEKFATLCAYIENFDNIEYADDLQKIMVELQHEWDTLKTQLDQFCK